MPLAPVYLSSISILPGIMFYTKHGRLHTLPSKRGKAASYLESPELLYASPLEALLRAGFYPRQAAQYRYTENHAYRERG